jgi:hypothetical protein
VVRFEYFVLQLASPLSSFIRILLAKGERRIHGFMICRFMIIFDFYFFSFGFYGFFFFFFFQWIDSLLNILLTAFSCNRPSEPFHGPPEKTVNIFETSAAAKRGLCIIYLLGCE